LDFPAKTIKEQNASNIKSETTNTLESTANGQDKINNSFVAVDVNGQAKVGNTVTTGFGTVSKGTISKGIESKD